MVVALFVAATAIQRAMAMANNHITLGNIAMILATGMFNSQILVSADAIHDFGYGTKFGTQPGKAVPGRTLGLGASPGPVGGSEETLLEVLHRMELYKQLAGEAPALPGYPEECVGGCPPGAHCSHGLCFCDPDDPVGALDTMEIDSKGNISAAAYDASYVDQDGFSGSLGNCSAPPTMENETVVALVNTECLTPSNCWVLDINSECSPDLLCACKAGTVYNHRLARCELDLSVDCSSVSPDSVPSPILVTLAEEVMAKNATVSPDREQALDSLLAFMEPGVSPRNYSKEHLLEAFCRDVDVFALALATGEDDDDLLTTVEETIEEVLDTSTKMLGMVVSIFLIILILVCLTACLCYCCHKVASSQYHAVAGTAILSSPSQDFKDKIKNFFAPTDYSEGLDNKAAVGLTKDAEAGHKDDLEKVISGYQPVPQHPPASYPQGANSLPRCQVSTKGKKDNSLPRGASLPRNANAASLKRGISPIPKAYPALTEAPPGYPESPQKTGLPPIGFPQSPPEYPQTPTPPGFPADATKKAALYPVVPEK